MAPGDAVPSIFGWETSQEWIKLDWTQNKATVVNFWAPSCQPCLHEMPELQKLHERLHSEGLAVVGVIWEETALSSVLAYLEYVGASYTILKPHLRTAESFRVPTLPTTLLVDGDGKLVRRYVGSTPEQVAGLVKDVEDFLAGRPLDPLVIPDPPSN